MYYKVDVLVQGEENFITYRGYAESELMVAEDAYAWYFGGNDQLDVFVDSDSSKVFKTQDKSITFYVNEIC